MIKSHELSSPKSCLNRAQDDEPLFVLRANDELAPGIVHEWAEKYRWRKSHTLDGKLMTLSREQLDKYKYAHELADEMSKWKARQEQRENFARDLLLSRCYPSCQCHDRFTAMNRLQLTFSAPRTWKYQESIILFCPWCGMQLPVLVNP